jgi:hypothetical protein
VFSSSSVGFTLLFAISVLLRLSPPLKFVTAVIRRNITHPRSFNSGASSLTRHVASQRVRKFRWWLGCYIKLIRTKFDTEGVSRDRVVGIATGYGLDDRGVGVWVPIGPRIFSSPRPDRLWGLPNLYPMGTGALFPEGKAVEVKKMWIYTTTPHTPSWRSAWLVKHKVNFTFTLQKNLTFPEIKLWVIGLINSFLCCRYRWNSGIGPLRNCRREEHGFRVSSTLKMEVGYSSETLVHTCHYTRCHNQGEYSRRNTQGTTLK